MTKLVRSLSALFSVFLATVFLAPASQGASLSVSPIRIDVVDPGNSGRLTLRNDGDRPITAQVRVFQWTTVNGRDNFVETRQVVVSPPVARLTPRGEFQVRLLRVGGGPVRGEETYRIIVDEVPEANRVRNTGVTVAIRYALPLFFLNPSATQPRVTWKVGVVGGRRVLIARNEGEKHLRVSNLRIGGVHYSRGLAGYVLGGATRYFDLNGQAPPAGGAISADTDAGPINVRQAP